jgi:hypothetical protein
MRVLQTSTQCYHVNLLLILGPQHNDRKQKVSVSMKLVLNSKTPVLNSKNTLLIALSNGIVGNFFQLNSFL